MSEMNRSLQWNALILFARLTIWQA